LEFGCINIHLTFTVFSEDSKVYFNDFGAVVASEEEQSSANQKVHGLIPGFPGPHVEVSLGKMVNPTVPLMSDKQKNCCRLRRAA